MSTIFDITILWFGGHFEIPPFRNFKDANNQLFFIFRFKLSVKTMKSAFCTFASKAYFFLQTGPHYLATFILQNQSF
jgi:hypothetical protein